MPKHDQSRRNFISYSSLGVLGLVLAGGVVFSPYAVGKENRLRPPSALAEKDFLALCIKCGQCAQVCPYHSIELADIGKGHGVGTPYIDARQRACYACNALPCVLACPSGALDHAAQRPEDISMGIAVFVNEKSCLGVRKERPPLSFFEKIKTEHPHSHILEQEMLAKLGNFKDQACTLCADMCPLDDAWSAIEMIGHKDGGMMPQVKEGCIGCGVCEELCPSTQASIVIKPRVTYQAQYEGKDS